MMLVIFGPTATGKTDLALSLARKFSGELISADSRQVYKNLDIGTGKVQPSSKAEKHKGYWLVDGVKIHGFDLVEPPVYKPGSYKVSSGHEPGLRHETFTAADFIKFANSKLFRIRAAKKLPIVVGGSGFYIKALLDGLDSIGIAPNPNLRDQLEKLSTIALFQKLAKINPSRANSMNKSDRANPRRLIRAIEVATYRQKPRKILPSHPLRLRGEPGRAIPPSKYLFISLSAPNNFLYQRADRWLERRLEKGLLEEVRDLISNGVDPLWLEKLGLEYRWITRTILGKIDFEKARERLKGDIHSYIRRQKTFIKQFEKISKMASFDISKPDWRKELEKKAHSWYTSRNGRGKIRN